MNGTVDADHMVNVDMYGNAELAHPDMRRRAALERGMTYRYGGGLPPPRHRFRMSSIKRLGYQLKRMQKTVCIWIGKIIEQQKRKKWRNGSRSTRRSKLRVISRNIRQKVSTDHQRLGSTNGIL